MKTTIDNHVIGFAGAQLAVGKTVAASHLATSYDYQFVAEPDAGTIPCDFPVYDKSYVVDPVDEYTFAKFSDLGGLTLLVWVGPRDDSEICARADHYLDSIQDVGYEEFIRRVDHLVEDLQQC